MQLTIAISNQKGGVGKTTTTINLAACLAMAGKEVLIIDIDPQANTTSGLGFQPGNGDSVYDALLNGTAAPSSIKKTVVDSLYLLPSDINLIGAEIELISEENRQYRLKNVLKNLDSKFDFVLIDCPPSLGLLTINSLAAADSVIIPLQTEYYALEGLRLLLNTIEMIRGSYNPSLEVEGLLFTMFDKRTSLGTQVVREVLNNYKGNVFKTIIPRNIRLSEAPSHGLPISLYDARSKGSDAYIEFSKELMSRCKEKYFNFTVKALA